VSTVIILGLDPGLAATGWGLVRVSSGRVQAIDFGTVRTASGMAPERRLAAISRRVTELIVEHQPTSAAVEELFVGANPRVILAVGQGRGAALAACGEAGVPVAEYGVTRIKQAVCGYGRAEKSQVQRMVRTILGLTEIPASDHAADALAAAICAAHDRSFLLQARTPA
jgi:crossover junction endodeoxyribonuclease RuvC